MKWKQKKELNYNFTIKFNGFDWLTKMALSMLVHTMVSGISNEGRDNNFSLFYTILKLYALFPINCIKF